MKIEQRLQRAFAALVEAVKSDPGLGKRLEEALGIIEKPPKPKAEKSNRRDPAVLDPYADYAIGEDDAFGEGGSGWRKGRHRLGEG